STEQSDLSCSKGQCRSSKLDLQRLEAPYRLRIAPERSAAVFLNVMTPLSKLDENSFQYLAARPQLRRWFPLLAQRLPSPWRWHRRGHLAIHRQLRRLPD